MQNDRSYLKVERNSFDIFLTSFFVVEEKPYFRISFSSPLNLNTTKLNTK